jgi:hypothetical protein
MSDFMRVEDLQVYHIANLKGYITEDQLSRFRETLLGMRSYVERSGADA